MDVSFGDVTIQPGAHAIVLLFPQQPFCFQVWQLPSLPLQYCYDSMPSVGIPYLEMDDGIPLFEKFRIHFWAWN